MSEYDFDALRDPEAPRPGSRERARVDARARQLRARARRGRLAMSSISILAVVAVVAGVVASQRGTGPQIQVEGPNSTSPSSVGDRFVPPTTTENGITTVPVTFPDGETTTLTYPEELRIAQLGFAGGVGVDWPVETGALRCCGRQISVRYTTIAQAFGNATPVKVYRGANGEDVPYFHGFQANPSITAKLDYLVFQFGPWLVQVYDVQQSGDFEKRMTDAQRATWARSLTGTIDDNGWLVLHAVPPLSINEGFDGGFGADPANFVELAAHYYCGQPESDSSTHRRSVSGGTPAVSWCVGKDLHVSASGTKRFVDLADTGLRVSALTPAPAVGTTTTTTATTTTTTTPVTTGTGRAVSASFVSPDHGWALETDGTVAETLDGGSSWRRVGHFPIATNFVRMRFADSSHGYALVGDGAQRNPLFVTTDAGAHWQALAAPFGPLFDFAVSRGTLYAVAMQPSDSNFRIWSAPVGDTLQWTEDPLVVRVGAGPVPSIQLVFSGRRGWLVEIDRVVAAGAQMAPSGRWTPWTPPCSDVLGPAELAASSETDLVASCQEHVWGGGAITPAVYFSNDGGATATRREAPESGAVASPNGSTAIVMGSSGLQRTTDGGATWSVVSANTAQQGPANPDIGFTTSTQGFAILQDGTMLMTHDAGASWQKVALP